MDPYHNELQKFINKQEAWRKSFEISFSDLSINHPVNKYPEFYASINSQFNNQSFQNVINISEQIQLTTEEPLRNFRNQLQSLADGNMKIIREQQEKFKKMISQMDNIYNQDFYLKNSINEIDVKESTELLENKISNLSTKKELSFEEKLEIVEALLFISDQEGENPDDFIKSFRLKFHSFVNSEKKISEKINNTSSETDDTKDEEKISKHELPPSFVEELFDKKTFQSKAIDFIYATFFSLGLSVVKGYLDPYIFLIIVSLFMSIFNRDKDK